MGKKLNGTDAQNPKFATARLYTGTPTELFILPEKYSENYSDSSIMLCHSFSMVSITTCNAA